MEIMFVEARSDIEIKLPKSALQQLPNNIGLLTTVQHISQIGNLKKFLVKNNKNVVLIKGKHSKYEGQILGCDIPDIYQEKVDAYLYIGTGEFHPKYILLKRKKPVYVFNPESNNFYELEENAGNHLEKKQKYAYSKFLESDDIGVLLSTKHGQYNLKKAQDIKNKFKDKRFYFLLFNTIDLNELENFPFIQCYVNTACPRIAYDHTPKPIINVDDIL